MKLNVFSLGMAACLATGWLGISIGDLAAQVQLVDQTIVSVDDGTAVSEIVIAPDSKRIVQLAAEDLKEHLKLISGAEIEIVTEPTGKTPIYVGESAHTRELGLSVDDIEGQILRGGA